MRWRGERSNSGRTGRSPARLVDAQAGPLSALLRLLRLWQPAAGLSASARKHPAGIRRGSSHRVAGDDPLSGAIRSRGNPGGDRRGPPRSHGDRKGRPADDAVRHHGHSGRAGFACRSGRARDRRCRQRLLAGGGAQGGNRGHTSRAAGTGARNFRRRASSRHRGGVQPPAAAAQLGGWRIGLLAAGGLLLSIAAVFELLASRWAQQVGLSVDPRLALRSGELWRLSTVTVLGYAAILGFTTWTPTTLVGFARIPLWAASLIASMLLIIDIPFAPLWGAVSDRIGRRRPFVIAAFTVYLIGSILVPWIAQTHAVAPLVLVIAGMGIGCAMFFPATLTIPAETVTRERVGAAYGLFFTAQVAGMLAGPVLIGQLLDAGSPALGFLGVSAVTALGLVAAFTLRSR